MVALIEIERMAPACATRFSGIAAQMHRDRKKVFVDQLGWNVPVVADEFEVDQFDDEHATYLVVTDGEAAPRHLGSVRLLASVREHILGDIFPELCMGDVPRGEDIYEITRLCIAPDLNGWRSLMDVRRQLAIGLTEYALLNDITRYTLVCLAEHLPQVLAFGWDVEPLGLPRPIEGQMLCAAQVNVTAATLERLRGERLADMVRRAASVRELAMAA